MKNAFVRPHYAFLRLYDNAYNKSCLEISFSRLVPLFTQQQYILPRKAAPNPFSLAILVLQLSQGVCLGKGSGGILTTLRYSFYLFSAASWKVYSAPLKPVRQVLSCFLLMSVSDMFSVTFTLNKTLHKTEWLRLSLVPELNLLLQKLQIRWEAISLPLYGKINQGKI